MTDYLPPKRSSIYLDFEDGDYIQPSRTKVNLNFESSVPKEDITVYVSGADQTLFGVTSIGNKNNPVYPQGAYFSAFGTSSLKLFHIFVRVRGDVMTRYGVLSIQNKNKVIIPSGLTYTTFGITHVTNGTNYIRPSGMDFFSSGKPKTESLRAYVKAGAYDFFSPGKPRISYKEQHVQTKQANTHAIFGYALVAHGVRYIEQHSPQPLTRYGTAWLSFSPRYIEPRGIFQQFPSYHRIGGSQTVKMEGFDFLRFGIRIIPESQTIRPEGFSTLFGNTEIRNNLHPVNPKGFLTAGEQIGMRFGQITIFNSDQYLQPFHDDTSRAAGPLFPDIKHHEIANLNRTIQTHGRINTQFGYADLVNNARVIYPVGLTSPLEVEPTKTFVADGVRYVRPESIEASYMGTWHNIWLGGQNKKMQGPLLSVYGVPHIENTRRYYRFIGIGEQTLFGKGMISQAVRGIRIHEGYSISPPVIPMPEVKYGVRYIEPRSIDSVRYGWSHLAEQFTKIAPRWVRIDRVGEPIIRNVTPQVKPWPFETAEYGQTYIGLYTRHIKPEGLYAQQFGNIRISDRKQSVDLHSYGISAPTISKLHKIENLGAGQLLPHIIYPSPILTINFETDSNRLHKITQNVIRQKSDMVMTAFGDARIHANSIRVEPGYWEILMGTPVVEHKNRTIFVDSKNCDFLTIGNPRMSPHTIYAVVEAPKQAISNHVSPGLRLHYVDSLDESGRSKEPGIEIGIPRISHKNRRLNPPGYFAFGIGRPTIYNAVNKIVLKGWNSLRMGVLGPIGDQYINFRPKEPMTQWGKPAITQPHYHDGKLKPIGLKLSEIGKPMVDHFHRTIKPSGLSSLAMGSSKSGDKPYMWQGLRIGEHVPTRVGGLNFVQFGTAWISYKVREAVVQGDDFAAVGEYEPGKFNLKMTIRNAIQPEYPRTQQIITKGFIDQQFGSTDTKLKLHFIRPDGNSDNFRKGGL